MPSRPELNLAKVALRRGELATARICLESILRDDPGHAEAVELMRALKLAAGNQSPSGSPKPLPTRWFRCPHCPASFAPEMLADHIARVHPSARALVTTHPVSPRPVPAPTPANPGPGRASKPKKRRKTAPILEDREWGRDALDHAVSVNSPQGVARIKSSKKKRGSRHRQ